MAKTIGKTLKKHKLCVFDVCLVCLCSDFGVTIK